MNRTTMAGREVGSLVELPGNDRLTPVDADRASVLLEDVSVRYRVPHEHLVSLKEYAIRRLQRRIAYRDFWAIRNVKLTIQAGEALGIVGRNGSGKTTLLKVIARVLRPTTGRVYVKGRIAPLLELGAAFHPELTGRENVYLNATLLGHPRREIGARFNAIVDFAELWDFIDAPLRTYSSGMGIRLGFAVATAWPADVLLVDEVLAVGDAAFQHKCLARMKGFLQQGAVLVLVSHNLGLVKQLCPTAIWLDHGGVRAQGPASPVVDAYLAATA